MQETQASSKIRGGCRKHKQEAPIRSGGRKHKQVARIRSGCRKHKQEARIRSGSRKHKQEAESEVVARSTKRVAKSCNGIQRETLRKPPHASCIRRLLLLPPSPIVVREMCLSPWKLYMIHSASKQPSKQRRGRIDSGEAERSPLEPSFNRDTIIQEIRRQQRSEERYVLGASHINPSKFSHKVYEALAQTLRSFRTNPSKHKVLRSSHINPSKLSHQIFEARHSPDHIPSAYRQNELSS